MAHADSRRGSRGNDVSGMKTHEPAHITDQVRDTEHHRGGRGVLIAVAINLEPEMQILWIRYFVRGYHPRTNRAKRIRALALHPLPRALELKMRVPTRR